MDSKNKYLDFYKENFGQGKYCSKSWGLASYEAGQQSKQAEIDALKMSNHHLSVQVLDANAYAEHWQKISNKSQAEIDKIKQLLKQWDDWISVSDGNNHIDIVKECADELRELLK